MNLRARTALYGISYLPLIAVGLPYLSARWLGSGPVTPLGSVVGVFLILAGFVLSARCVNFFVRLGKGTQSPLDPPRHLVIAGPYRYVRNPMILGNVLLVLGEAALFSSRGILIYAVLFIAGWHVLLVRWEEPSLRRRFGAEYEAYLRQVPRWLPRFRPAHTPRIG